MSLLVMAIALAICATLSMLAARRLESIVLATVLAQLALALLLVMHGASMLAMVQATLAAGGGALFLLLAPVVPERERRSGMRRRSAVHVLLTLVLALLVAHPFLATAWLPAAEGAPVVERLGVALLGRHALVLLLCSGTLALVVLAATHLVREPAEDAP